MGKFEKLLKDPDIIKKFKLDEDDVKELMEMHQELTLNRKERNDRKLKIDDKLPKIYVHRSWCQKMIAYYNEKMVDDEAKDYSMTPIKEGYMILPIGEIMEIEYPDQDDVTYAIQQHTGPKILEHIRDREADLRKDWEKITIYFKINLETNKMEKLEFYQPDGNRIAETKFEGEDKGKLKSKAPYIVTWKMKLENNTELEMYSLEIDDIEEATTRMLYSSNVILYVIMHVLDWENSTNYLITKENLSTSIKKKDNETIDLHREVKTQLKKNEYCRIYYLPSADEIVKEMNEEDNKE